MKHDIQFYTTQINESMIWQLDTKAFLMKIESQFNTESQINEIEN